MRNTCLIVRISFCIVERSRNKRISLFQIGNDSALSKALFVSVASSAAQLMATIEPVKILSIAQSKSLLRWLFVSNSVLTIESAVNSFEREVASIANYHHPCWAFKKGRQGLFPADHCIKIIGYRAENASKTMIIRTCALDSGTLTADTEIVRISHCGHFKYESHHYTGCVQACDSDGCNSSNVPPPFPTIIFVIFSIILWDCIG
ncbi:hypothetical protein DICVIV_03232 [Dictyocaulus viviparus]|uniref:Protein quiver n=1 Tax=Dictyocaulus viviparus TaxID=29172 RepID=A0A0D8Y1S7_DICVI|nr:hypothetical protein DICVIV_03232 [Dictyocaulus viviparus]